MKPTTLLLPLLPLTLAKSTIINMAEKKTCTPSFDYCADELIKSNGTILPFYSFLSQTTLKCEQNTNASRKGFTKDDLKDALKGSDVEEEDLSKILFHCKNPGDVGHPKVCQDGCKGKKEEGSGSC